MLARRCLLPRFITLSHAPFRLCTVTPQSPATPWFGEPRLSEERLWFGARHYATDPRSSGARQFPGATIRPARSAWFGDRARAPLPPPAWCGDRPWATPQAHFRMQATTSNDHRVNNRKEEAYESHTANSDAYRRNDRGCSKLISLCRSRKSRLASVPGLGCSGTRSHHVADESQTARSERQHVGEPAVPADRSRELKRAGSDCCHLPLNCGAMLAAQEREAQSAADVVQPQHDVVCQLPGKPRIPRPMASCHCLEFEHPGTGAGDRYLVPRTDRACSYHHGRQREEERLAHLAELGATLIPVLRGWFGCVLAGS